jgi:dephospho-CoA kinase
VVNAFGRDILDAEGKIDRRRLGNVVFCSPHALARLHAIVNPLILQEVGRRVAEWRRQGIPVVVVEAALLIEAGWSDSVDEVWVVVAPEEAVVRRLTEGKGAAQEDVRARIRAQLSNEERMSHADRVIENDGTLDDLRRKVRQLWEEWCLQRGIALESRAGGAGDG